MVQPLMALLTVLGAAGAPASEPGCPVETRAGMVVATPARCEEVAALREERERLLQSLGALGEQAPEALATGGSGEDVPAEPPAPTDTPEARREADERALAEELRALRTEVDELRQAVRQAEARAVPPPEPTKAAEGVREEPKSEREEALELLRNTDTLTVVNADPAERQVLGEVNVANRTQTGEVGFILEPQVRVGTPWKVEFGASAQVSNLAGEQEGTTGSVGAYALGQLVEEKRVMPQLALLGEVTSPRGDEGVSAEARLLATKRLGETRLHGNVGYSVRQDAPDDYLLGLAADHPIGDRLLLQGDAYYTNPLGAEDASVNASVGTGLRVGSSFVVTGAVGVNATDTDVAPRLLFGVLGRI
ncbi:hypothetical protein [Archangium sp.]|uniref:hypothetical protein n=1 Tax=Archangium sp. TaxID=1872627 RepID=UPI00286CB065|nr:hypothetical protein [Archangium sp.]